MRKVLEHDGEYASLDRGVGVQAGGGHGRVGLGGGVAVDVDRAAALLVRLIGTLGLRGIFRLAVVGAGMADVLRLFARAALDVGAPASFIASSSPRIYGMPYNPLTP